MEITQQQTSPSETLPETKNTLPAPPIEIPARALETGGNSFGALAGIIIIIIILIIGALYFWGAKLSENEPDNSEQTTSIPAL